MDWARESADNAEKAINNYSEKLYAKENVDGLK
jgi:hypothetical protein